MSPLNPTRGSEEDAPFVEIAHIDELWLQVGGTLCNLTCRHCFISCHPGNRNFGFLSLADVRRYLVEAAKLGVKEYYLTGGEPFLNRELIDILEAILEVGPTTVLTNATVLPEKTVRRLVELSNAARYSLELRVSIDGYSPETNDPIRGEGTFELAMRGLRTLVEAGLLPIVTVAQTWPENETATVFDRFVATLRSWGYERPRLKILPTLRIGAEAERNRPYEEEERVTERMMEGYPRESLLCSRARIVTDRGVAVCPILIEAPDAHLGSTLAESLRPYRIRHGACYTCYQYGAICSNFAPSGKEAS